MKRTYLTFCLTLSFVMLLPGLVQAQSFVRSGRAWKLELGPEEIRRFPALVARIDDRDARVALSNAPAILDTVNSLGGERGVTITGVVGVTGVVVTPRGSTPLYEDLQSLGRDFDPAGRQWGGLLHGYRERYARANRAEGATPDERWKHWAYGQRPGGDDRPSAYPVEAHILIIQLAYLHVLRRSPDPDGLRTYTRALRRGDTVRDLIRNLAGSDEFFNLCRANVGPEEAVRRLYRTLLGRDPDRDGMITYRPRMNDAESFKSSARELVNSDEYSKQFGEHVIPRDR